MAHRVTPVTGLRWLLLGALLIAGCGGPDSQHYFPGEPGRWWQYTTVTTILEEVSRQKIIIGNLGLGTLEGREVLVQRVQSQLLRYYQVDDAGVVRIGTRTPRNPIFEPDDPPVIILPAELTDGATFTVTSGLRLIESRTFARTDQLRPRKIPIELTGRIVSHGETITVPAGTFEDCLLIESSGKRFVRVDRGNASAEVEVLQREWFAPDVGLVRLDRSETSESPFLTGGEYQQLLEKYR